MPFQPKAIEKKTQLSVPAHLVCAITVLHKKWQPVGKKNSSKCHRSAKRNCRGCLRDESLEIPFWDAEVFLRACMGDNFCVFCSALLSSVWAAVVLHSNKFIIRHQKKYDSNYS